MIIVGSIAVIAAAQTSAAPFIFSKPSAKELQKVRSAWARHDLSPHEVSVLHRDNREGHAIAIYRHRVSLNRHHGVAVSSFVDAHAPMRPPVVTKKEGSVKKGHVRCEGVATRYAFLKSVRVDYPLGLLFLVFDVSRSGCYAAVGRPPSQRAQDDERLKVAIKAAHVQTPIRCRRSWQDCCALAHLALFASRASSSVKPWAAPA